MKIVASLCLAAFVAALPVSANAIELVEVTTPVALSTGAAFKPVTGATGLSAGNRVMARANGRAVIQYDNGCRVVVDPGQVITVAAIAPCAGGPIAQESGGGLSPLVIGGGIAAGAGIIAAIAILTSDNGTSP